MSVGCAGYGCGDCQNADDAREQIRQLTERAEKAERERDELQEFFNALKEQSTTFHAEFAVVMDQRDALAEKLRRVESDYGCLRQFEKDVTHAAYDGQSGIVETQVGDVIRELHKKLRVATEALELITHEQCIDCANEVSEHTCSFVSSAALAKIRGEQ